MSSLRAVSMRQSQGGKSSARESTSQLHRTLNQSKPGVVNKNGTSIRLPPSSTIQSSTTLFQFNPNNFNGGGTSPKKSQTKAVIGNARIPLTMLRRSKRQTGKSVNRSTLKIAKISKNTVGGGLSSVDERSGTFEVAQEGS